MVYNARTAGFAILLNAMARWRGDAVARWWEAGFAVLFNAMVGEGGEHGPRRLTGATPGAGALLSGG